MLVGESNTDLTLCCMQRVLFASKPGKNSWTLGSLPRQTSISQPWTSWRVGIWICMPRHFRHVQKQT